MTGFVVQGHIYIYIYRVYIYIQYIFILVHKFKLKLKDEMLPCYLAEIGFQYFILVNIYYISNNGVFVMVLISVLDSSNNNPDIYVNIL